VTFIAFVGNADDTERLTTMAGRISAAALLGN
jgi:hypothetical protein